METRTFWLGQLASADSDQAYCGAGCGSETDRSAPLGVHVSDGTGRMRLVCGSCARKYADQLSRIADIKAQPIRLSDLPLGRNAAKYELFAIEEPTECDELPCEELPVEEIEIEETKTVA